MFVCSDGEKKYDHRVRLATLYSNVFDPHSSLLSHNISEVNADAMRHCDSVAKLSRLFSAFGVACVQYLFGSEVL